MRGGSWPLKSQIISLSLSSDAGAKNEFNLEEVFPMYRVRTYGADRSDSWRPIYVCSVAKCIWCHSLVRFLCKAFMLLGSILHASHNMHVFLFLSHALVTQSIQDKSLFCLLSQVPAWITPVCTLTLPFSKFYIRENCLVAVNFNSMALIFTILIYTDKLAPYCLSPVIKCNV